MGTTEGFELTRAANPSVVEAFPQEEFIQRWNRLQRAMAAVDLDAVLVTSHSNFEYLTGYRTPSWLIRSRPLMVVLPASGTPVAVVSSTHALDLAAGSSISNIRDFSGFENAATDCLVATLRELGLISGRIGIEAGHEQRLGMPLEELRRLEAAASKAELRDGGGALWAARLRKSENEIHRLRIAGQIAGGTYEALLSELRAGWTEGDVYRLMATRTVELGGEAPGYVTMTGGPGAYAQHNAWPRERAFATGELFWVDLASTFGGYYSDYTRCAAIGQATPEQEQTYQLVLSMLDEALSAVRAGAKVRDIFTAANAAAGRRGVQMRVASRIGHGVGLDLTEPPSLTGDSDSVLESGMVLAVEPGVLASHGWYHLEENLVVTDDGYELLSAPQPRELSVAQMTGGGR